MATLEELERSLQSGTSPVAVDPSALTRLMQSTQTQGATGPLEYGLGLGENMLRQLLRSPETQQAVGQEAATAGQQYLLGNPNVPRDVGIVPTISEATGQAVGSLTGTALRLPMPAVQALRLAGGALGAAGGVAFTRYMRGERVDLRELENEALLSAAPEAAEATARGVVGVTRAIASRGPAGQIARKETQRRLATNIGEQVFESQTRQETAQMFDAVRASGEKVDISPVAALVQNVEPETLNKIRNAIRNVPAQATREFELGQKALQVLDTITEGLPTSRQQVTETFTDKAGEVFSGVRDVTVRPRITRPLADIGQLQQVRSGLRQARDRLEESATRDALQEMITEIDRSVNNSTSRAIGRVTPETALLLMDARRQYFLLNAAEEFNGLFGKHISVYQGQSGPRVALNLNSATAEIEKNSSLLAQTINENLDRVPGARRRFTERLQELSKFSRYLELSIGSDVAGFSRLPIAGQLAREFGEIALSAPVYERFRQFVISRQEPVPIGVFALFANAARRQLYGTPGSPPAAATTPEGLPTPGTPLRIGTTPPPPSRP